MARFNTGCQSASSVVPAMEYTPSRSVYGVPWSFKNSVKMNLSSSASISAARRTEVTLLATGGPSNCSSSAAKGSSTAGPVTTIISSSFSSAVDKNTCSWSDVVSADGHQKSTSSGKHARTSRRNRS